MITWVEINLSTEFSGAQACPLPCPHQTLSQNAREGVVHFCAFYSSQLLWVKLFHAQDCVFSAQLFCQCMSKKLLISCILQAHQSCKYHSTCCPWPQLTELSCKFLSFLRLLHKLNLCLQLCLSIYGKIRQCLIVPISGCNSCKRFMGIRKIRKLPRTISVL